MMTENVILLKAQRFSDKRGKSTIDALCRFLPQIFLLKKNIHICQILKKII